MPYSITTKDGITIQNIPDEEPADSPRLKERVAQIRGQMNPPPTDRQELLSSMPMRLAKGMKDPIDGLAQLARRAVDFGGRLVSPTARLQQDMGGPSPADMLDAAANKIAGPGTFAGDVLGVKGASNEQLRQDIAASDAEYEAARKATSPVSPNTGDRDPGFDAARLIGNLLSPANIIATRAAPSVVVNAPVRSIAARGAAAGAMGAAAQPVTGEDFALGKAGQMAAGAAGGAVLTPVIAKAGEAAARAMQRYRSMGTVNVTPEGLRQQIVAQLRADGIEPDTIPDAVFQRLTTDVRSALANGRELDPAASLRQMDFQALGLPALRGQVTRDPSQWQREFNLAGVEGVGEPLQQVAQAQSRGIQQRFQQGARGAAETFDAGQIIRDQLQAANRTSEQNVRAAYDAFRQHSGRDLEVPLQGLAQDYARTLETFGDSIPGAVRRQFESLGLMSGTQRRGLTIDQAEGLIKAINANTDPANRVASRALGELRRSVQGAIVNAADNAPSGAGAEAASLAAEARALAAQRFRTIDDTPALRAAIQGAEPDDFVNRFVLRGKVNEIQRMQELLGPEGRDQVRAQTVAYLQNKAFGANAAGDGKAAQASFNQELLRIGRPKLVALLGEQGADEMFRIGRVLAYIKQAPEGATPNTSGTGQMLTSLLGKTRGLKGLPYVNDYLVQPLARFGDRQEVQQALRGAPQQPAQLDPRTVEALASLFAPVPVVGGAALGYSGR